MHFSLPHRTQAMLTRLARLVPSPCALCAAPQEDALCSACRRHYLGDDKQRRCRQCAARLTHDRDGLCGECLARPPAFDASIVATDYAPPIDQLILALKFGGCLALAPLFAELLRDAMLRLQYAGLALPSIMTAVPLGTRRLAERGFNQALEIAKPLARATGIPLMPQLACRVRDTTAQSLLPPKERHDNLRHAFTLAPQAMEAVRGRHVGIVDDVITTGATLDELAATFKRFGAARVTILVVARTPGD